MVGRCEFKQIWPQGVSTMGDIERFGLEENTIGRKKCSRKINVRREFLFLFNTLYFFVVHCFPSLPCRRAKTTGVMVFEPRPCCCCFFGGTPSSIVHRPSSIVYQEIISSPPGQGQRHTATTQKYSTHPTQYTVRC